MSKLGKTNDYPRGKLSNDDEGGIQLAIGVKDRTVVIDFGTQVVWIGLDKQTALQFADAIRKHAESL